MLKLGRFSAWKTLLSQLNFKEFYNTVIIILMMIHVNVLYFLALFSQIRGFLMINKMLDPIKLHKISP